MEEKKLMGIVQVFNGANCNPQYSDEKLFLNQVDDFNWLTIGNTQDLVFIECAQVKVNDNHECSFNAFYYCLDKKFRFNIPTHIKKYVYGE